MEKGASAILGSHSLTLILNYSQAPVILHLSSENPFMVPINLISVGSIPF